MGIRDSSWQYLQPPPCKEADTVYLSGSAEASPQELKMCCLLEFISPTYSHANCMGACKHKNLHSARLVLKSSFQLLGPFCKNTRLLFLLSRYSTGRWAATHDPILNKLNVESGCSPIRLKPTKPQPSDMVHLSVFQKQIFSPILAKVVSARRCSTCITGFEVFNFERYS